MTHEPSDASVARALPASDAPDLGCDYQGYEFGGGYLDSVCIEGFLWDADSCMDDPSILTHGGDIPCPQCNKAAYDEYFAEYQDDAGDNT